MAENNVLAAYQEALQCYEQLEFLFRQPQYLINVLTGPLINVCVEKIQNLVNMELQNIADGDFDIYYALLLIQQRLACIKDHKSIKPPIAIAVKTTAETQKPKQNDQELREMIDRTRTPPRIKGLREIGGLVDVKQSLAAIIVLPIHQPQLYADQKICNSILLYGPPGTGKTLLAHALAAEASATLFSVTASDILSQYVGQTEKLVNILFQVVKEERNSSTILFMDEIDGLCRCRNNSESEWNRRLKTELMCQLSAFERHPDVFLICATNCPWDLDPAFLRRFQRRIYVPLPTRPDRFELLKLLTKGTPLEIMSHHWNELLNRTEGYSGSDLSDLVRYTLNIPVTELINNKQWEKLDFDIYQPASESSDFANLVYCELWELPRRSVQARKVHMADLMSAVDVVKPTVSDKTIRKYEEYITVS